MLRRISAPMAKTKAMRCRAAIMATTDKETAIVVLCTVTNPTPVNSPICGGQSFSVFFFLLLLSVFQEIISSLWDAFSLFLFNFLYYSTFTFVFVFILFLYSNFYFWFCFCSRVSSLSSHVSNSSLPFLFF